MSKPLPDIRLSKISCFRPVCACVCACMSLFASVDKLCFNTIVVRTFWSCEQRLVLGFG